MKTGDFIASSKKNNKSAEKAAFTIATLKAELKGMKNALRTEDLIQKYGHLFIGVLTVILLFGQFNLQKNQYDLQQRQQQLLEYEKTPSVYHVVPSSSCPTYITTDGYAQHSLNLIHRGERTSIRYNITAINANTDIVYALPPQFNPKENRLSTESDWYAIFDQATAYFLIKPLNSSNNNLSYNLSYTYKNNIFDNSSTYQATMSCAYNKIDYGYTYDLTNQNIVFSNQ